MTELVGESETVRLLSNSTPFLRDVHQRFPGQLRQPFSKKKKEISLPDFENILLSQFREQLKEMTTTEVVAIKLP